MSEEAALLTLHGYQKLPHVVKTLSGATFDPSGKRWAFHDRLSAICVNFNRLGEYATEEFIEAAKIPLIWYSENAEASTVGAIFENLRVLLVSTSTACKRLVNEIDAPLLTTYRASLSSGNEWKLGGLRAFLKKWYHLGVPGVTGDAIRFLNSIRLKGVRKGTAVLTMDPLKGPLTDVERSAVQAALNDVYSVGKIPLEDYLLAWLCLLLGQRNIQFAMLKVCDVAEIPRSDGVKDYVLKIPRVKQFAAEARRKEFKERLITPSIGKLLIFHANNVLERFKDKSEFLGSPSQAPLFPKKGTVNCERPTFHEHSSPEAIGHRIKSVFSALRVNSERTGEPIKVTSKRLRHTVATSAAREGHGELIIAELLDHSDTQNVGVYVQATPEIIERIDQAIALQMAPLAHAFAGDIIGDESAAIRGNDPRSRIVDPRFDASMKPMGNCSRCGSCDFMAPIACYTCKSFQAWIDGPHEAVLEYLLSERERLMSEVGARIATVNDRTIFAVAEVVKQARDARKE